MSCLDVETVNLDMRCFGLTAVDSEGEGYAKKPTRVLTNLPPLAASISRRCIGNHRHVHLVSGKAKAAANYTEDFCNAIIDGVATHLECLHVAATSGKFSLELEMLYGTAASNDSWVDGLSRGKRESDRSAYRI